MQNKRCMLALLLVMWVPVGDIFAQGMTGSEPMMIPRVDSTFYIEPVQKRPWTALGEVVFLNVLVNRFNKWPRQWIQGDAAFACVTWDSWQANIKHGPEWDWNSFQINWIGHPYQGAAYYNSARSLGMNFWTSAPYAFFGSLTWEYFGETHPPSGNDLVTTTLGGIFLGETLHRLSDQILDDRSAGSGRVWREIFAALVNPVRGFNRLVGGEARQQRRYINHMRAPMQSMLSFGGHFSREAAGTDSVKSAPTINFGLIYGDAFEERDSSFKPFDLFALSSWLRITKTAENTRSFLNAYGYGILWGKQLNYTDRPKHVAGIFHHLDYINNEAINIGAMTLAGGLLSDFQFTDALRLQTSLHAGPIVLGGANSEYVDPAEGSDDPGDTRDYIMGPGVSGKLDLLLQHKKFGNIIVRAAHWTIKGVDSVRGTERLNIVNSRIMFPIWNTLHLGVEHTYYRRRANYEEDRFVDIRKELNDFKAVISFVFN